ncbi:hypothetical protein EJ08DRAFT_35859 [Tothia fuscella]|uniref:Uncharacterized protein n=1 Tax=Tothia fuscella TaxID=1048955 RepID=A0A9P4NG19_9PEZI|nr:hypothetical protein EJ08DRAFT_35859 [Tothia fuscella]
MILSCPKPEHDFVGALTSNLSLPQLRSLAHAKIHRTESTEIAYVWFVYKETSREDNTIRNPWQRSGPCDLMCLDMRLINPGACVWNSPNPVSMSYLLYSMLERSKRNHAVAFRLYTQAGSSPGCRRVRGGGGRRLRCRAKGLWDHSREPSPWLR